MRTEINIWTEGFNKELLSPVCLWLENVSSSGGERHVETTDEKKKKTSSLNPRRCESPKPKITRNTMASAHYSGRRISEQIWKFLPMLRLL